MPLFKFAGLLIILLDVHLDNRLCSLSQWHTITTGARQTKLQFRDSSCGSGVGPGRGVVNVMTQLD